MLTIIVGTNRRNNEGLHFAEVYKAFFEERGQATAIFSLENMPLDAFHPDMYDVPDFSPALVKIQDELIVPAKKFFFVVPEYNGGMPGALKLFIDALSVRKMKDTFYGKKAAMVGVSSGRAGNLRGMEHLTAILNFLEVTVMPNRQPISRIHQLMDAQGNITDEATLRVMERHAEQFIKF